MVRALTVGSVAAASVMIGWSTLRTNPDACRLLSAKEASALAGSALVVTHTSSTATFATCVYRHPNENPLEILQKIPDHVEIHYRLSADAAAAHTQFPKWVAPGPMAYTTVTAVPHVGDEAAIIRTAKYGTNGINFRHGAALLSIGVSPLVGDSALKAAAATALSRL